jgi:hypothetical protein
MIEVFVIKYDYAECIQDNYAQHKVEYFEDEVDFKVRLRKLKDWYEVSNIIVYCGTITKILVD